MAKMSISVTDQQARWIDEAVKSGGYSSASEVIREALRGRERDHLTGQLFDEGGASGGADASVTFDRIKQTARESLKRA